MNVQVAACHLARRQRLQGEVHVNAGAQQAVPNAVPAYVIVGNHDQACFGLTLELQGQSCCEHDDGVVVRHPLDVRC